MDELCGIQLTFSMAIGWWKMVALEVLTKLVTGDTLWEFQGRISGNLSWTLMILMMMTGINVVDFANKGGIEYHGISWDSYLLVI